MFPPVARVPQLPIGQTPSHAVAVGDECTTGAVFYHDCVCGRRIALAADRGPAYSDGTVTSQLFSVSTERVGHELGAHFAACPGPSEDDEL